MKRPMVPPSRVVRGTFPSTEVDAMFSIWKTLNVGARGVRFMNLFWNSAALLELGLTSVQAGINPEDLGYMLVFTPSARFVRVPNTHPAYACGLSLQMHMRFRAHVRKTSFDITAGNAMWRCLTMIDLRRSEDGTFTIEPSTSRRQEHLE